MAKTKETSISGPFTWNLNLHKAIVANRSVRQKIKKRMINCVDLDEATYHKPFTAGSTPFANLKMFKSYLFWSLWLDSFTFTYSVDGNLMIFFLFFLSQNRF